MDKWVNDIAVPAAAKLGQSARAAAARGDFDEAERCWRKCIERQGEDVKAQPYCGLAEALEGLGRLDEAGAVYELVRARWPEDPVGWTGAARSAAEREDWEQTERLWRECIQRFDAQAKGAWYCGLAVALEHSERREETRAIFTVLRTRWPDIAYGWIGGAQNAVVRQDWAMAESLWRGTVERFDEGAKAPWYYSLAGALQNLGRRDEADTFLGEMRTRWPDNPSGWTGGAENAAARSDWGAAHQLWRETIERFEAQAKPNWYYGLAAALNKLERLEEAHAVYERLRERWPLRVRWPSTPGGWAQAAERSAERNDWERVERLWRECLERFESKAQMGWYGGLAKALRNLDRWSEADAIYELLRKRWPKAAFGWSGAAQNAAARKDWKTAESLLRDGIERLGDTTGVDLFSPLAIALQQQGRLQDARDVYRAAQKRFPNLSSAWATEARIAAASGAWRRSGHAWERAAEKAGPDTVCELRNQSFKAFLRGGRFADAQRMLAHLVKSEPDEIRWLSAGFEWFSAQGDARGAVAYLEEQTTHPAFQQAFPAEQLAGAVFELGLAPPEAIERLAQWMPHEEAARSVDKVYSVSSGSFEEASSTLDDVKNQRVLSTYQQRSGEIRAWARKFLRNRTYKAFSARMYFVFSVANDSQIRAIRSVAVKYFPASRLRARIDEFLERGVAPQQEVAFASGWRTKLPQPGNSILDQLKGVGKHRLVCATIVRDEAEMLSHFVPYYMSIGVTCFVIVDNGSVDGLAGLRDGVPGADVIVVDAPYNFARNRHGITWINEIHESGICDWLLYVDADEQLIFPGFENRRLPELLDHLEARGETGMSGFMLDVYDEGYKANVQPSAEIQDHNKIYAKYTTFNNLRPPFIEVIGGIRFSEFHSDILAKTPLMHTRAGVRMLDNHYVNACKPAQITCALLHYKIFRDRNVMNQTPEEIASHSRIRDRGVNEIVRHLELSSRAAELRASGPFHVTLRGTSQLLGLGYFSTDADWREGLDGPLPPVHAADAIDDIEKSASTILDRPLRNIFREQLGIDQLLKAMETFAAGKERRAVRLLCRRYSRRIDSPATKLGIMLFAASLFSSRKVQQRIADRLIGTIAAENSTESAESIDYVTPMLSRMASDNRIAALTVLDALDDAGLITPALSLAKARLLVSLDQWPEANAAMAKAEPNQQNGGNLVQLLILRHLREWTDYHGTLARIIGDEEQQLDERILYEINRVPDAAPRYELLDLVRRRLAPAWSDLQGKDASLYLASLCRLGHTTLIPEAYGQLQDRLPLRAKTYFSRYLEDRSATPGGRRRSVWCLGLSKTGTTSLHAYAQMLGLLSAHFFNPVTGDLLGADDVDLFDVVSDTPIVYLGLRDGIALDRKLIVTTRDYGKWENSFLVHFKREFAGEANGFDEIKEVFYSGVVLSFGERWFDIHHELYFKHDSVRAAYDYHCDWINTLERKMEVPMLRLPLESDIKSELVSRYLGNEFPVLEYPTSNVRISVT